MDSGTPLIDPEPREPLEIERSAVRGVSYMVVRTLGLQVVTGLATIALVRILSPADFGAFAVAQTVQLVGRGAVELGIPLALVRRETAPTLEEERALTGLMLTIGAALAALALAAGFVVLPALGIDSRVMQLTAVACCSLPLYGVRAVPVVLLERRLSFGKLVTIEIAETIGFYGFAVPTAIAGLGAWSLAAALPVSALLGILVAVRLQPWRFGAKLSRSAMRPLFGFGIQTGLLANAGFVREMGLIGALAAVGGEAMAGFYGLSQRIFSIPLAIMYAIHRVAVASLARTEAGAPRVHSAVRAAGLSALAISLPLALIAGAADPLIAVLFGERWLPTADIVVYAAGGVLLTAGLTTGLTSLSLADGDARTPLIAWTLGAVVSTALAALLVDPLGTTGAGIASACGYVAIAGLLVTRVKGASPPHLLLPVARALAVGAVAAAAGGLSVQGTDVRDLAIALTVSTGAWTLLALVLARDQLFTTIRLLRRHALP